MGKTSKKGEKFEEGLAELESVVARLESGDTTLEESLALFEKGTEKLKKLTGMLDEAQRKVEILTKNASGTVKAEPFKEDQED
ncbi:exodeoxyribonuclease VII small subunit [bacterium]|nr:MAG: exodeoxyribonuclease VII small subunit [bacterium]